MPLISRSAGTTKPPARTTRLGRRRSGTRLAFSPRRERNVAAMWAKGTVAGRGDEPLSGGLGRGDGT
ncbi:hypothetical protein ACIQFZ_09575 [Streptomyces sp. NPDC093064]|uniref:hypothetical protein n=1 Tax=unclassified Streptomyces TaxID=2593676 RepID=UPI00343DE3B7